MIEGVCNAIAPLADAKGVDLSVWIAADVPALMLGDPTRLRQILTNLAGNAVKFSGGRAQTRGRVALRVELPQAMPQLLRVHVIDNGIGMTADTIARLFTPFTQADAGTTRRFGGTGLGLAITKRLVELMLGEITVESRPGEGTRFIVTLPMNPVAGAPAEALPSLSGLDCILIRGTDITDAADLSAAVATAGARVHLDRDWRAALARATKLSGPVVVIRDLGPGQASDAPASLPAGVCMLLLRREQRWRAHLDAAESTGLELGWLRRDALLRAIAIAAGRLPLSRFTEGTPMAAALRADAPPSVAEARAQGQLILLAEDDEINRTVIVQQLNRLGYATETASTGRAALAMWRSGEYALLLTDLYMPEMDGYQLAAAIRQEEACRQEDAGGQRTPILALSANALRGEAERARSFGVDMYLTKPILLHDLQAAMTIALAAASRSAARAAPAVPLADLAATASALPVFDVCTLMAYVGDETDCLESFLAQFSDTTNELVGDLRDAIAREDLGGVRGIMHKLKTSCRFAGALHLAEMCDRLERFGNDGDLRSITQIVPAFESGWAELATCIADFCMRRRSADPSSAHPVRADPRGQPSCPIAVVDRSTRTQPKAKTAI